MAVPINSHIFDHSKEIIAKECNLDISSYLSQEDYIDRLISWNQQEQNKQKQAYELISKSKLFLSSFQDSSVKDIRCVVYFITHQHNLLYIGSTTTSFNQRYFKKERTRLVRDYEKNLKICNKTDEEIFVRHFENENLIRKFEAKYINLFSAFGLPSCNIKCENYYQFMAMLYIKMKSPRILLKNFIKKVWDDVENLYID